MTIAECRAMKKGDQVYINLGNGCRQHMTYLGMYKVMRFPKMTLADVMSGNFDLRKGKEEWMVRCEYIDDHNKKRDGHWRPRAVHKVRQD